MATSSPTSSTVRSSLRHDVEDAALELIHSVMEEDWSSEDAGRRVWSRAGGNRHVLLILRARVARHLAGRHSPLDERAAATLDAALRTGDQAGPTTLQAPGPGLATSPLLPQQRTG